MILRRIHVRLTKFTNSITRSDMQTPVLSGARSVSGGKSISIRVDVYALDLPLLNLFRPRWPKRIEPSFGDYSLHIDARMDPLSLTIFHALSAFLQFVTSQILLDFLGSGYRKQRTIRSRPSEKTRATK